MDSLTCECCGLEEATTVVTFSDGVAFDVCRGCAYLSGEAESEALVSVL